MSGCYVNCNYIKLRTLKVSINGSHRPLGGETYYQFQLDHCKKNMISGSDEHLHCFCFFCFVFCFVLFFFFLGGGVKIGHKF